MKQNNKVFCLFKKKIDYVLLNVKVIQKFAENIEFQIISERVLKKLPVLFK